jgi:hypothetical protein
VRRDIYPEREEVFGVEEGAPKRMSGVVPEHHIALGP